MKVSGLGAMLAFVGAAFMALGIAVLSTQSVLASNSPVAALVVAVMAFGSGGVLFFLAIATLVATVWKAVQQPDNTTQPVDPNRR